MFNKWRLELEQKYTTSVQLQSDDIVELKNALTNSRINDCPLAFINNNTVHLLTRLCTQHINFNRIRVKPEEKLPTDARRLRNISIVFVGFGGYMSNLYHYFMQIKGDNYPRMSIYEPDCISFSNIPRMFGKLKWFDIDNHPLPINKIGAFYDIRANCYYERLTKDSIEHTYRTQERGRRIIFVGSPDHETRKLLENEMFFFFGNRDNSFTIVKSPTTTPATMEGYGKIDLVKFKRGMIDSAVAFNELLNTLSRATDEEYQSFMESKDKVIKEWEVE